jgi:hypothetical protein
MIRSGFHPSLQSIQGYLEESLPDCDQADLEDHFAECEQCMATVRRMDALLFSGFTARAHAAALAAEALQADPLAQVLRAAQQTYGEYAATLRAWLESAAALWDASQPLVFGEPGAVPVRSQRDARVRASLPPDETRAIVHVLRESVTVEVSVAAARNSLVVLFAKDGGGVVRVAQLRPGPEGSVVVFENIPLGEYYLALAPPELKPPPPLE